MRACLKLSIDYSGSRSSTDEMDTYFQLIYVDFATCDTSLEIRYSTTESYQLFQKGMHRDIRLCCSNRVAVDGDIILSSSSTGRCH